MSECVLRKRRSSRKAWIDTYGPIPEGLHVCHTCDNECCVNLDHLWLGTHAENMADAHAKGRVRKGGIGRPTERRIGGAHPGAKLTEEAVREIRASNKTQLELAIQFSVSQTTISNARRCLTWRHVA